MMKRANTCKAAGIVRDADGRDALLLWMPSELTGPLLMVI
jgi:hypothetical protein